MDIEAEYDNCARVPKFAEIQAIWQKQAKAYRDQASCSLDLSYGYNERQCYDLFMPEDDAEGRMVIFVHGGYWRALDKSWFSHLASGLNSRGIPVALPSYRLCPDARVSDIIGDLRAACLKLWHQHERRLVVAGHSAGGHLAACMLATDWNAHGAPSDLVRTGFGISGIYDLRPLMNTTINQSLRLNESNARLVSPLLWPTPAPKRFEAWVGADESGEYLRQSHTLAATWTGGGAPTTAVEVKDANHFTVLAGLTDGQSPITMALAGQCGDPS